MFKCQKLYKQSLKNASDRKESTIEGPSYHCLIAEQFLDDVVIMQGSICERCPDRSKGFIKKILVNKIIKTQEVLYNLTEKLKDFEGDKEVKETMLIALKKGNRKIDDIINVSEELNIVDKEYIKELILVAANYGGCNKKYLLNIVKKYKLDKE